MRFSARREPATRLNPICGRAAELAQVATLLGSARLVSLVGAPGIGKTRVALEVTARSNELSSAFVSLAEVRDPADVAAAFATGLGVSPDAEDLIEEVARTVTEDRLLILVDNAEHVLDACRPIITALLLRTPELRLLVTSRERLGVDGEQVVELGPLTPDAAASLFTDRIRRAGIETSADAAVVREVCRRLDHLPSALEIAASWAPVLTPSQVLHRLDLVAHSEVMAATVGTSLDLLGDAYRELFARLSVFAGRFDLTAAQAVAAQRGDVLTGLATLVGSSLVLARPDVNRSIMQYRLLEPLRQQAGALLDGTESEEVGRRHAEHYAAVAERSDRILRGTDPRPALLELVAAESNLMVAGAWAQEHDPSLALRLATDLARYWEQRGHLRDASARLAAALATAPDAAARLRAMGWQKFARLKSRQRHYSDARDAGLRALSLTRDLGDDRGVARSLRQLAEIELVDGRRPAARERCQQSVETFRAEGDRIGEAWSLTVMAIIHFDCGEIDRGADCDRTALSLNGDASPIDLTIAANVGLSYAAALRGDLSLHRHHLASALERVRAAGPIDHADWLWSALHLAGREGRPRAALRLAGAAHARGLAGSLPVAIIDAVCEAEIARVRSQLGRRAARRLEEQGARMPLTDLMSEALADSEPADRPLTTREREVADLVGHGLGNDAIAERLQLSRRTVESHIEHLRHKLDLSSRFELVAWAIERRLEAAGSTGLPVGEGGPVGKDPGDYR